MTEYLRTRMSSDLTYANRYLEVFRLSDRGTANGTIDEMINEILHPPNVNPHLRVNDSRLECLKLMLLMKMELPQNDIPSAKSAIGIDASKCIINICLSDYRESNPSINYDVIEVTLWLLSEGDFTGVVEDLIKTCKEGIDSYLSTGLCTFEGVNIAPINVLNLLEAVMSVLCKKHEMKTLKPSEIDNFFKPLNYDDVLVELIFNENNILSTRALMRTLPNYLDMPFKSTLLKKLWERSKRLWKGILWEDCEFHQVYVMLCSMANYIFPQKLEEDYANELNIINDNKFWEILLCGMGNNDPSMRKRSRFLLKKALDFVRQNPRTFVSNSKVELFCWDKDSSGELFKTWSEYLLVLEALEEKQTHLIEPILKSYETSMASNRSGIISAWNLPVFQGMLCHDSNSITKWGMRLFLTQNLNSYSQPSVDIISFILHPVFQALNNNYLFMKQEDEFEVECGLKCLFSSIKTLSKEIRYSFLTQILVRICGINWSPVPLFYIIKSLSSVDFEDRIWDKSSLATIKSFLTNTIHTYSPLIRGAIQICLIKVMTNLINTKQLNLFHMADVIGAFSQDESLKRGADSWRMVIDWLKVFTNEEKANFFVSRSLSLLIDPSSVTEAEFCVSSKVFTRMCLLLFDASFILVGNEVDQSNTFHSVMHPLFKVIVKISSRPYVKNSHIDCNIRVLSDFLEESSCLSLENDVTKRVILGRISGMLEDIMWCYRRRLFSVRFVEDYETVNLYMRALHLFSKEKKLMPLLIKASTGLLEDAFHVLESQEELTMPKYFCMKILNWLTSMLLSDENLIGMKYMLNCEVKLFNHVKHNLALGKISKCTDLCLATEGNAARNIHMYRALIKSEYVQSHWFILHSLLRVDRKGKDMALSVRKVHSLVSDAIESIEIGGRDILSPVMSVMQILMPEVVKESVDLAVQFFSVCWKATFEHKKSEYFWTAIEKFIKMVFQESIMLMLGSEKYVLKYAQELYSHGQTIGRIFHLLVSHLRDQIDQPTIWKTYYPLLVDALVFGPILRKDQKIYKDTCEYILSLGTELVVNTSLSCELSCNTLVRVNAVAMLLIVVKTELGIGRNGPYLCGQIADHLWKNILHTTEEKSRYYGNSHVHRLKQRAMQSLLLLEVSLNEEQCQRLMNSICESLRIESHQPSVKYLQEWLLVRILLHHPNLRHDIWKIFQEAGLRRPGCMSSFISVAFHLAKSLPRDERENFIDDCIRYIHPWCMAQQFIVRLYSQVVLQKLWSMVKEENYINILNKYQIVFNCISSCIEQGGNLQRNLQKLKESFYFSVFHAVDHFSIETIYYDIPRLGNVSSDEWIPPSDFKSVNLYSVIRLKNEDETLRSSMVDWAAKANIGGAASVEDGDQNINIQKKIMPWKCDGPEDAMFSADDMERGERRRTKKEGNLIVVASLIDRAPNLGGLCRTCEAFGVSEYVLGSLKFIEDPQFQNLSVSAERWISISEVKPFMLASYLQSKKEKGYILIGAEQTSSSVKLNNFKFPRKSLLLLGNEKEGIPADLLPLMDVCVEVPQEGLVRSLNVHVTGAIFIWEYLQQHLDKNE